jgi:hypothetical protein
MALLKLLDSLSVGLDALDKFEQAVTGPDKPPALTAEQRAFLQADFEHFADSYQRNEELGERRFQLFIAVVTAVLGGVGFLAQRASGNGWLPVKEVAIAATLGLLGFGLLTLMRVLRRNEVTNELLAAMKRLREQLAGKALVDRYFPTAPPKPRPFLNGGMKHLVAVVNGGLGALLAFFWLQGQDQPPGTVAAVLTAAACLTVLLQSWFIDWREART